MTNAQWQHLKRLLPRSQGAGRPIKVDLRGVIDAIFYLLKSGCQWRNLPRDYPNFNTVYYHYRKWCLDGTWQRINREMMWLERRRVGRFPRPSAGIMDSQSVKVGECGGLSGYDGNKRIKGRKRHILVDTEGNLLEVMVSAANLDDRKGAKQVMTKLESQMARCLLKIWVDKGYQGDLDVWFQEQWQILLEVVSAEEGQKGFVVQPRRWVVERTFSWLGKFRRLSKDYERDTKSSEGLIYLASIRLLLKRLDK